MDARIATFVLIHGGMHGGWCWDPIVERLSAAGHRVEAPDLPGLGDDATPHGDVTLARTADRVADIVRRRGEPVVLVGHSMGGLVISETAERVPDHLAGLIYLAAVLRPGGESGQYKDGPAEAAQPPITVSDDGQSFIMAPEVALERLYNTSPREAAERAVRRLQMQPILSDPLTVTDARFGRVPRAFIECRHDRAVPLDRARRMQAVLPCDPVFTLDCDHSPFLSAPDALTACLIATAGAFAARRQDA